MEYDIVATLRVWAHDAALQDAREHCRGLNDAAREIERLRAERDEARREIVESLHPDLRDSYVAARGWDCFKEADNG